MIRFQDALSLKTGSQLDGKLSNFYRDKLLFKIESIEQYLIRVKSIYRVPGVLVTMLVPDEDYGLTFTDGFINYDIPDVSANDYRTELLKFDIKYYTFINGIADEDFKEVGFGYTYVGYASDLLGSDFSMTMSEALDFMAILTVENRIEEPQASDFAGLWYRYKPLGTSPATITESTENIEDGETHTHKLVLSEALKTITGLLTGWDVEAWYSQVTPSFDELTRTFTLTPIGVSYRYFVQGILYTKYTAESIQIPNTDGINFIVYDGPNLRLVTISEWTNAIKNKTLCMVTAIYWNTIQQKAILKAAEPHTHTISGSEHYRVHTTMGTRYGGGLILSLANTWQLNISEGSIIDEDIPIYITDNTSVVFGQNLTVLESKKLYRLDTGLWYQEFAIPANIATISINNRPYHNLNVEGTWTLEETALNKFSAMWLVATDDFDSPIVCVMGQGEATTLALARSGNDYADMDLSGLPSPEFRLLGRVLIKAIAASPYYEIVEIEQYQKDDIFPGGDITNDSYVTDAVFDQTTNTLTLSRNNGLVDLTTQISFLSEYPNNLLSGGQVVWIENYDYAVASATYTYNFVEYVIPSGEVSLSPANDTYPRIDLIVLNLDTGTFGVVEGIPWANPLKPQTGIWQVELTEVLVLANSTSPSSSDISGLVIYDENIEWTPSTSGVVVDFDSTILPYRGLKCASVGSVMTGSQIFFTSSSTVNSLSYTTFSFNVKFNQSSLLYGTRFYVRFLLSDIPVSDYIQVGPKVSPGNWQLLAIELNQWTFTNTTFDTVEINFFSYNGVYSGFFLDFVRLQLGVVQPLSVRSITLYGDVSGSAKVGEWIPTTLATVNENVGTFGSPASIPIITVNKKGLVLAIEEIPIQLQSISIHPDSEPTLQINESEQLINNPLIQAPKTEYELNHGFTVGTCIKLSGTTWIRAIASSGPSAGTIGLVYEVIDANNFKYITGGLLPGSYTVGALYFLSTTSAGNLMTLPEPEVWSTGQVREYIGCGTVQGLLVEIDVGIEFTTGFTLEPGEPGEPGESHPAVTIDPASSTLASINAVTQVLTLYPQESGANSYLDLTDTSDTTYTGKDIYVPVVNESTGNLDLTPTELLTGATGTFTSADGKTITVINGIITSIV